MAPFEDIPSGVEDSFLRLDGGASRLRALGWCSGDRTMADMAICCLAVAGVDGCGWSAAFRWAAGERRVQRLSVSRVPERPQPGGPPRGLAIKGPRPKGHTGCPIGNAKDAVNRSDAGCLGCHHEAELVSANLLEIGPLPRPPHLASRAPVPSSRAERSSMRVFCRASSSSAQRAFSFSRATFSSLYCRGTCVGKAGSSFRRLNKP